MRRVGGRSRSLSRESTSAYQIVGGLERGREGVVDLGHIRRHAHGKIKNEDSCDAANDHFHRYRRTSRCKIESTWKLEEWRVCPGSLPVLGWARQGCPLAGQTSEPQATANGEVAWRQCGRSHIPASMNARPGAWRHGIGRLCRVIRSGARPRTDPTRSPCWRSRTVPASRTWCRSVTAG